MKNILLKAFKYYMRYNIVLFIQTIILFTTRLIFPQVSNSHDSLLKNATLQNCIQFALVSSAIN